ncbi:MAG: ATP-binding protein [Oscillibacter sp.]|nr:ATP-binding protein [Oscillibacter sp.]
MDERKQYPKLTIHHLGPIQDCEMIVNDFTVFVGPQSQGKSTIAKAVYFFRSVKGDIIDLMLRGLPLAKRYAQSSWDNMLDAILTDKFSGFFDDSFCRDDTVLRYDYTKDIWIRVSITQDDTPVGVITLPKLEFSDMISAYLASLDKTNPKASHPLSPRDKTEYENALNALFHDDYAPIYIPAGRHLTTLLSSQLNYVLTSMNDAQRLSMDYLTIDYIERILRLRPLFEGSLGPVITRRETANARIRTLLYIMLRSAKILGGKYRSVNGAENLVLPNETLIPLRHASSGQQEAVWPLNLMFYYLLEEKKTFLVFEEPESNLYPDSQRTMGELLALFRNAGNQVMVTTHSPYLLGTFNYLLMGSQCESAGLADGLRETLEKEYQLTPDYWLSPGRTDAYFVSGGGMENAVTDADGVRMIRNELIDAVSEDINAVSDLFLGKLYHWDDEE